MNLLLDNHIAFWALNDDSALLVQKQIVRRIEKLGIGLSIKRMIIKMPSRIKQFLRAYLT